MNAALGKEHMQGSNEACKEVRTSTPDTAPGSSTGPPTSSTVRTCLLEQWSRLGVHQTKITRCCVIIICAVFTFRLQRYSSIGVFVAGYIVLLMVGLTAPEHAAAGASATFAGMSSALVIIDWKWMSLQVAMIVLVFELLVPFNLFKGYGGWLGVAPLIATSLTSMIYLAATTGWSSQQFYVESAYDVSNVFSDANLVGALCVAPLASFLVAWVRDTFPSNRSLSHPVNALGIVGLFLAVLFQDGSAFGHTLSYFGFIGGAVGTSAKTRIPNYLGFLLAGLFSGLAGLATNGVLVSFGGHIGTCGFIGTCVFQCVLPCWQERPSSEPILPLHRFTDGSDEGCIPPPPLLPMKREGEANAAGQMGSAARLQQEAEAAPTAGAG